MSICKDNFSFNTSKMDPAVAREAAAFAKQQPMLDAMAQGESEVQRFYNKSVIFITGGSGFMGKQLIEKLFRSCHISKLYVLLRPKKGLDIRSRLEDVLNDPVFDMVRKQKPNFTENITAIEGDVAKIKLGIKDEDWKLLTEEVDIIFHVAAITKFDENLKTATLINVRGTREALSLGRAMKRLRSYVHVSTAFSQATKHRIGGDVKEEFYDCPIKPELIISMVENLELDTLDRVTAELIEGWPNTYAYTKSIAEELIRISSIGLPICIVRPGIVSSTYLEPVPGWMDKSCLYTHNGLILGCNLGVAHAFYMSYDKKVGYIPCDLVNNTIIVAAKETAANQMKGGANTKIYTVSSTNRNLFTYRMVSNILSSQEIREISSPKSIYYSFNIITPNKFMFRLLSLFLHDVPAYVADFVCMLTGKERRFASISKKFFKGCCSLSYFTINEWNFLDENLQNLYNGLTKQDKAIFNIDVTNICWKEYMINIIIGARRYIYNDGLKDTEFAQKKQKFLKMLHYIFVTFYAYGIWKMVCFLCTLGLTAFKVSSCLLPLLMSSFQKQLNIAISSTKRFSLLI